MASSAKENFEENKKNTSRIINIGIVSSTHQLTIFFTQTPFGIGQD